MGAGQFRETSISMMVRVSAAATMLLNKTAVETKKAKATLRFITKPSTSSISDRSRSRKIL